MLMAYIQPEDYEWFVIVVNMITFILAVVGIIWHRKFTQPE